MFSIYEPPRLSMDLASFLGEFDAQGAPSFAPDISGKSIVAATFASGAGAILSSILLDRTPVKKLQQPDIGAA